MSNHVAHTHTSEYSLLGRILVLLMFLTLITILVAVVDLGPLTLTVALLIAGVKSYFVLAYFMHLKYESLLLRVLVGAVFFLFVCLVLITYIDYYFR